MKAKERRVISSVLPFQALEEKLGLFVSSVSLTLNATPITATAYNTLIAVSL
ncbi:hypothetical protein [Enterovibrio norvegicus]|uniref:hypothetical protein n=1 Tax=Enterovibrio norvegicus TaxID=188144 RepID=UPI0013000992|nr:hypothetical protein [Enterovibrio norvegicus]